MDDNIFFSKLLLIKSIFFLMCSRANPFLYPYLKKRDNCLLDIQSDGSLLADTRFEAFARRHSGSVKLGHRTPRNGCSRLRRENNGEMTFLPLTLSSSSRHARDAAKRAPPANCAEPLMPRPHASAGGRRLPRSASRGCPRLRRSARARTRGWPRPIKGLPLSTVPLWNPSRAAAAT